jgi:cytochrome c oxidase subunit 2
MFGLGTAVYVLVLGILFYAIFRARRPAENQPGQVVDGNMLIIGGGIVIPLLVLPIIWAITLRSMAELAEPPSPPTLTVEVTGHQWWYEVRDPERGISRRNEMRIPAGEVVQLRVGSADVIHSFWIPRLMGKIDMIPGRINQIWFAASQPGTYLVECAEFCGLQHATMQMEVVAMPAAEFAAWLTSQRR